MPIFVIPPVGACVIIIHINVFGRPLFESCLQFLHILKVGIHYAIMIDHYGIAPYMIIQHERLAVVARQTIVDGIMLRQFLGKCIYLAVNEISRKYIICYGRCGLPCDEQCPKIRLGGHALQWFGAQQSIDAIGGHHTASCLPRYGHEV